MISGSSLERSGYVTQMLLLVEERNARDMMRRDKSDMVMSFCYVMDVCTYKSALDAGYFSCSYIVLDAACCVVDVGEESLFSSKF